jgi:hypothetical protein
MQDKELKIIKTQGTKESIGAFMVFDKKGNEFFDELGNNAWDTYYEALEVYSKNKS